MCDRSVIVLSGHSTFESGGVGTHLRMLDRAMKGSGFVYSLLMGKPKIFSVIALFMARAANCFGLQHSKEVAALRWQIGGLKWRLRREIKKFNRVVVDCHDLASVLAAEKLKSTGGYDLKIVYTVHAPFFEQYLIGGRSLSKSELDQLKSIEMQGLAACDAFVFVDDKQKEIVSGKLGDDLKAAHIVLPNAIDVEYLNQLCSGVKKGNDIVVARHLYQKCGVHVAIEAFAKADIPGDVRLIIIGMGDQYDQLKKLVAQLVLGEKVIFKGRLPHAEAVRQLAAAKISLVPSVPVGAYVEATSLTMLESMAVGTPLIASDIGGLRQVLLGKSAGVLVSAGDADELARAISAVYSDAELADTLAKHAIDLVSCDYSLEKWLGAKIRLYGSI